MPSSTDTKNLGGRPRTGIGTPVMVRLQPDDLTVVDGWRDRWETRTGKPISRPEMLRELIRVVIKMGGLDD